MRHVSAEAIDPDDPTNPVIPSSHPQFAPSTTGPGTPRLGIVALVVAIVAAAGGLIFALIGAHAVGVDVGTRLAAQPVAEITLGQLAPVNPWILTMEIAFWIATLLGLWALVQSITAIATHRGRPQGIAGAIVAVAGPTLYVAAGTLAFTIGLGAAFAAAA